MKEDNSLLSTPHHTSPPVTLPSANNNAINAATTVLNKNQIQVNGASLPSATNGASSAVNNGVVTNGNTNTNNNAQTNKSGYKIVVNNYHAHSILSSKEGNNIATCIINTPPLDGNSKLLHQIGDAPSPLSKVKHIENFISTNTDKSPKPKTTSNESNDLPNGKDYSCEGSPSSEDVSPSPTPEMPPPKTVIVIQNNQPKCEILAGEDDIGSNLDDDDDEDLGGEMQGFFFKICFQNLYFLDIDNLGIFDDTSDSEDEYAGFYFKLPSDDIKRVPETNIDTYIRPNSVLTPSLFPLVPPYLTFSNHVDKGPSMPPELQKVLKWKLSPVMPKIVKKVVLNSGFRLIKSEFWFYFTYFLQIFFILF